MIKDFKDIYLEFFKNNKNLKSYIEQRYFFAHRSLKNSLMLLKNPWFKNTIKFFGPLIRRDKK